MKDLTQLRNKINKIDQKIVELLAQRVIVVRKVGELKKKLNLPILDSKREEQQEKMWSNRATELGLDARQILKIWNIILDMCKTEENNI